MKDMSDLIEFAVVMLIVSIPILAFTVGRPLARAWARRINPPADSERHEIAALESRIEARLQRLESYVQTMAVEVERIGEANRYLLNAAGPGRAVPAPAHAPASPGAQP